jgi:hypothetical protein
MTRAPSFSLSDDAEAKRLATALSQMIQLLARQSVREIYSGALKQENSSSDVANPSQKNSTTTPPTDSEGRSSPR